MNDMLSQHFHVFLIGSPVLSHLLKNGSRWIGYIKLPLNVKVGTPKATLLVWCSGIHYRFTITLAWIKCLLNLNVIY